MKRIHFVVPYNSVAMYRMSQPLIVELAKLYNVSVDAQPDPTADLNFHIPYHTLIGYERGAEKHAIAYTHCNAGAEDELIDACNRADMITCMSFTGRGELLELGVDPAKIWTIYAAADQYSFRKRLIGIAGYPQPNGRKREGILLDLAWGYDMTPFQFLFAGSGWEETILKLQSLGVSASSFIAETDDKMRDFYQRIDALLVTGYREGGSLPILEAMASGAEVISPKFGYSADLLDVDCYYETVEELADVLHDMVWLRSHRHKLARAWRWQDYCSEHALLFGRLLGENVDLYPEYGASRYMQLLDIIDGVHPETIAEIGTWSGSRAIQLIQQASKYIPVVDIDYLGFDLFETQTGAQLRNELSKVGWDCDVVQKRIDATGAKVTLIKGDTRETMKGYHAPADFIFVDGGHSEKTIKNDGAWALRNLNKNGVAVFDDYYHEGKPVGMGCNNFIDNLPRVMYEVTHLPNKTTAADGRVIGMTKVKKA